MTGTEIAKALKLDAIERRILTLYYTERLTIAEIAYVLDLTAKNIEQQRRSLVARIQKFKAEQE